MAQVLRRGQVTHQYYTHSSLHSLITALIHHYTCTLLHSLIAALTHWCTHSLVHSLIGALTHCSTLHSLITPPVHHSTCIITPLAHHSTLSILHFSAPLLPPLCHSLVPSVSYSPRTVVTHCLPAEYTLPQCLAAVVPRCCSPSLAKQKDSEGESKWWDEVGAVDSCPGLSSACSP